MRDAFSPFFILINIDEGHSEELEVEEARKWFKDHGANMDVVEKAMDYVWNLYGKRRPVVIVIANPRNPDPVNPKIQPRL